MNCKPGDLAVIVWAPPVSENLIGCVVRVKALSSHIYPQYAVPFNTTRAWTYSGRRLRSSNGLKVDAINDCCLRPIRDNGGTDETLLWADKPQPEVV